MEPNAVTPPRLSSRHLDGYSERRRRPKQRLLSDSTQLNTLDLRVIDSARGFSCAAVLCAESRQRPCALFPLALSGVNMLTKPAQVDGPDLSLAQLPALVGALVDAADRGCLLLGEPCRLPNRTEIGRLHVPPISRHPGHAAENSTPTFRGSILDTANGRQVVCTRPRPLAV